MKYPPPTWLALGLILWVAVAAAAPLEFQLRRFKTVASAHNQWEVVETRSGWEPSRTAAVVCDILDHPQPSAA